MKRTLLILTVFVFLFSVSSLQAKPTDIVVHVKSKGAKFIGTSMGGVLVTIKDVHTGELMAKGKTSGSTGDTELIMKTPLKPGENITTEETAKFEATLDIQEPRLIEVTAIGPMAQYQSANKVSVTQWLVPGKGLDKGDGLLLILQGMVVDVLNPAAHLKLKGLPQTIDLQANVTMGCGCPINPGGLWEANDIEVRGLIYRNEQQVSSLDMQYAGKTSQFKGSLEVDQSGTYEVVVYAYDPSSGNTGLDRVTFVVKE